MAENPKRISDEIRLIKAQNWADDLLKLVVPLTRSIVIVVVVVAGSVMMARQIPIPPDAWKIALVMMAAFFGSEILSLVRVKMNGK